MELEDRIHLGMSQFIGLVVTFACLVALMLGAAYQADEHQRLFKQHLSQSAR